MKIISFVDERILVRQILKHLNLWQESLPKGLPPPEETIVETIVCEGFDDGWSQYDGPDGTLY
jgi:hypothetical protein